MYIITPFDQFTLSNHQGIHLDINILKYSQDFFKLPQLFQFSILLSTKPLAVAKYKQLLINRSNKYDKIT